MLARRDQAMARGFKPWEQIKQSIRQSAEEANETRAREIVLMPWLVIESCIRI
jgi:hypothetical protein